MASTRFMTVSIWWLIALLQLTIGAIIATVFYAVSSKISKGKVGELKALVQKTIQDYTAFADSHSAAPSNTSQPTSDSSNDAAPNSFSNENTTLLHSQALERLPDWTPANAPIQIDQPEFRTVLELQITHALLQEGLETNFQAWHEFFNQYLTLIQSQTKEFEDQQTALSHAMDQWTTKKPTIQEAFNQIVAISQSTDHTSEIHECLNTVYNEFLAIINDIPGLSEKPQDALMRMESVASADELEQDLEPSEETGVVATAEAPQEPEKPETVSREISPENILPLSQHDLNTEDDELDQPPSAIQEFEETPEVSFDPPKDGSPAIPETTGAIDATDTLTVDDDLFDGLLDTMDEVIEEQSQANGEENEGEKSA